MPFSLRLDADTERKIRRLARATGRSRSAVVREAMAQYDVDQAAPADASPASVLTRLRPFLGVVGTGGAQYSTDTHRSTATKLAQAARDRRAR